MVTTRFRSLAATGHQEFSWFVLPSDDEAATGRRSLVVEPGKDKGQFTLLDPFANQPGCAKAAVDRAARTVTLTIPASCLGDPDWVRVGNGVRVYLGHYPDTREYADDARRDGVVKHGWKYGPKVRAASRPAGRVRRWGAATRQPSVWLSGCRRRCWLRFGGG